MIHDGEDLQQGKGGRGKAQHVNGLGRTGTVGSEVGNRGIVLLSSIWFFKLGKCQAWQLEHALLINAMD